MREPVGELPALHPHGRRARIEHRHAENDGAGLGHRARHELGNARCWMLRVGVHGERVRVAFGRCGADAVQHGGTLAAIFREHQHSQAWIRGGELAQPLCSAIRASVDHDPHRVPELPRAAHSFVHCRTGVVARDEDEMCCGPLRHGDAARVRRGGRPRECPLQRACARRNPSNRRQARGSGRTLRASSSDLVSVRRDGYALRRYAQDPRGAGKHYEKQQKRSSRPLSHGTGECRNRRRC